MILGMRLEVLALVSVLFSLAWGRSMSKFPRSSKENSPEALVIPPSEYFEGNDGPWSTFNLRVGTPEQDVRVIVSTASPASFVVLSEYGCSPSVFETVPTDCAVSRGNLLNPDESSSWHELGLFGVNGNGVGFEANLGYSVRTEFATEKLGLGLTGPSLDDQTVAGIADAEPFYLGLFGLNNQPLNFTSLGNFSSPSFLTMLKDRGIIPSLSWSYTAGARYRLKQVYGQLILSGYDTSRFVENSASFSMAGDVTRDLIVILQSVSYSGSTSATLLSDPIDIFIDSTDPNLWLPEDVCDAFEQAFGLTFDGSSDLYLINETQHTTLLNSDAEVTFRLSDIRSGGEAVRIVLPYAAFDLIAKYPLVENESYYFPLKRGVNSTQYTLGRTFLQEAYLTADYERGTFNVSACLWRAGAEENIVTISSKHSCTSSDGCSSDSGASPLSGGAIAGIVVGIVVTIILIGAAVLYLLRRERKKKSFAAQEPPLDMAVITGPVHNHHSCRRTGKYYSPDTVGVSTDAGGSEDNRNTNGGSTNNESSQQELDGQDTEVRRTITPREDDTEVHQLGRETETPNGRPAPVYHELGGKEISKEPDTVSNLGSLPPGIEREEGGNHLDSAFVSTLGSVGWQDDRADGSSKLVTPVTPTRRGGRQVEL